MQKRPLKKHLKSILSATKLSILLPNITSRSNFDLTGKGSPFLFSENYSPRRNILLYNEGCIPPPHAPFKQEHNINSVQLCSMGILLSIKRRKEQVPSWSYGNQEVPR